MCVNIIRPNETHAISLVKRLDLDGYLEDDGLSLNVFTPQF